MPPHAQMSLAQLPLIRALIAAFWKRPYRNRLVHWGTKLHDRFMLPFFVEQEMRLRGPTNESGFAGRRASTLGLVETPRPGQRHDRAAAVAYDTSLAGPSARRGKAAMLRSAFAWQR
jgi:hypothetical protein